ncbi:hypothetical protein AcV7_000436 [Taiwanofungus camphoratus]|nr:hypothetical protein AcV7_000436 [Antrodia cinnamomea]
MTLWNACWTSQSARVVARTVRSPRQNRTETVVHASLRLSAADARGPADSRWHIDNHRGPAASVGMLKQTAFRAPSSQDERVHEQAAEEGQPLPALERIGGSFLYAPSSESAALLSSSAPPCTPIACCLQAVKSLHALARDQPEYDALYFSSVADEGLWLHLL